MRNPADRAYSAWKMEKERFGIKKNFGELFESIKNKEDNFLYKSCYLAGMYGHWFDLILNIFSQKQIMLIKFEDLVKQPLKICKECFEFLDLSPEFEPKTGVIHNKNFKPKSKLLIKMIFPFLKKNSFLKKYSKS